MAGPISDPCNPVVNLDIPWLVGVPNHKRHEGGGSFCGTTVRAVTTRGEIKLFQAF